MTDRELLEAAAKAAGHGVEFDDASGLVFMDTKFTGVLWNPLHNDGDALRLAVALRLELDIHHTGIAVRTPDGHKMLVYAEEQPDAYAATRRAIVRAAAAMA